MTNRKILSVICVAALCSVMLNSYASAQQKTVKACQEEWRADKAANQAKGITEKAYVAECRKGASSQPTAAPIPPPEAAPARAKTAPRTDRAPTAAGQKTVRACQEEWRADKAANQAKGITEKAYVAECRGGGTPTQSTVAPSAPVAPAATAAPPTPASAPTATAPRTKPVPTSTARPAPSIPTEPAGANQFSTEAQAKARCPSDTVVWVNLVSKVYHFAGTRNYGKTKKGAYMCESDTAAEGMRAAKNETHP